MSTIVNGNSKGMSEDNLDRRILSRRTSLGVLGTGAVVALAGLGACSSNDTKTDSTGSAYGVLSCPSKGSFPSPECATCLRASCASQVSKADTACADAVACKCPIGVDAAACPPQSSSCDSASMDLVTCLFGSCAAACGAAPADGGAADGG